MIGRWGQVWHEEPSADEKAAGEKKEKGDYCRRYSHEREELVDIAPGRRLYDVLD